MEDTFGVLAGNAQELRLVSANGQEHRAVALVEQAIDVPNGVVEL